jgi:predicted acetyltransferase
VFHESHTSGVGIMYRVLDVRQAFEVLREHNFGGQSCTLQLAIDDSFLPSNHGSLTIGFDNGKARLAPDAKHDVEVQLNIAHFSSLLTGAVDFKTLYRYGLAEISSEDHLHTVDAIFRAEQRPWCVSRF